MENIFIESLIFEHQMLSDIDSVFLEFTEGIHVMNGQYLIEEANSKSDNIFTKLFNMIKRLLSSIKKIFLGESDEKKDIAVNKMEEAIEYHPELKNKTKKVIDPNKVMKLSKEDLKQGAKTIGLCLVSMSIPTAIMLYKNKSHKKEAQKLEDKINKLSSQLTKKQDYIKKLKDKYNELAKRYNTKIDEKNELAKRYNTKIDEKKALKEKNKEIQDELDKAKKELSEITEELSQAKEQLDLLNKSKQQVDDLATGKVIGETSDKKISNINNDTQKSMNIVYNTFRSIYSNCDKKPSNELIINSIKETYHKDKIIIKGISENDINQLPQRNRETIMNAYSVINKEIKKFKDNNISFDDFIKEYNHSKITSNYRLQKN